MLSAAAVGRHSHPIAAPPPALASRRTGLLEFMDMDIMFLAALAVVVGLLVSLQYVLLACARVHCFVPRADDAS